MREERLAPRRTCHLTQRGSQHEREMTVERNEELCNKHYINTHNSQCMFLPYPGSDVV